MDGKRQEVIVLDSKRSNAINIGLTVLPPPRTIKTAILNFDEYALNKEGIEVSGARRNKVKSHPQILLVSHMTPCVCPQKILTMIPTEEEKQKIQEAQLASPDVPLGSAEQFLLTLSSISELSARLQLWAFKMDYETTQKVCHGSTRFCDEMRLSRFKIEEEVDRENADGGKAKSNAHLKS